MLHHDRFFRVGSTVRGRWKQTFLNDRFLELATGRLGRYAADQGSQFDRPLLAIYETFVGWMTLLFHVADLDRNQWRFWIGMDG